MGRKKVLSEEIRGKMKRRVWIRIGDVVLFLLGTSNPTNVETSFGVTRGAKLNGSEKRLLNHLVVEG